jgi:metal-responsive CopG/Arc/MetJ family transcriptional regulator
MRNTKVVSISLPAEMLEAAEIMAKRENRTMSELIPEALRVYQRERLA